MQCDKCGKDMGSRSIEHQIDHTFFLCDDCYQKLVEWINADDEDIIPLLQQLKNQIQRLQEQVNLNSYAAILAQSTPLPPPYCFGGYSVPNADLVSVNFPLSDKGFEEMME